MRISDWSSDVCSSDLEASADEARAGSVAMEIRAQARGRLKKFYASRGFWPLWASAGKIGSEAQSLIGFLETAELDGLKSSTYKVDDLREAMESARGGDPRQIARSEEHTSELQSLMRNPYA